MDPHAFESTRRSLHALAELLLAGPQYVASEDVRLRATPGGFGTTKGLDARVDGVELVVEGARHPLTGTYEQVAQRAGLEARSLSDVYSDGPAVRADDALSLDADAAASIADVFARGDAALRSMADEEPVLWPEHFDIGISLDEVNFGVSPGDSHVAEPYAYVGPWVRREGPFWNMSFGAIRPMRELPDVDSVAAFFREGAEHAAADPPAGS
jgi:hypothetical protein